MRARKIVMSLGRVFITMLLLQCMLHVHPAVREDNLKAFVGHALDSFASQLSRAAHFDTARHWPSNFWRTCYSLEPLSNETKSSEDIFILLSMR